MHDLVLYNPQFIIATHAPVSMAYPNATIDTLSGKGVENIAYYDTEHFQVTLDFLVNPRACSTGS